MGGVCESIRENPKSVEAFVLSIKFQFNVLDNLFTEHSQLVTPVQDEEAQPKLFM